MTPERLQFLRAQHATGLYPEFGEFLAEIDAKERDEKRMTLIGLSLDEFAIAPGKNMPDWIYVDIPKAMIGPDTARHIAATLIQMADRAEADRAEADKELRRIRAAAALFNQPYGRLRHG